MKEPKVTYQPIGRLGNQMFQLAACIGYAKKYGVQWGVPNDTKEVPRFHEFFPGLPRHDGNEFRRYNAADPSQFNYQPIPFNESGLKLVGFFQSEKYFEGANDEIRSVFKLDVKPIDAVSIHVRRGDYVKYSDSFPPLTFKYISDAVELLRNKGVSNVRLIYFSDDIEWCKSLPNPSIRTIPEYCEEADELRAMSLMSSCKHNIIANSTFSWWGSWLNPNPDKIVISPHHETWFGPANGVKSPPVDLIPSSWHQIRTR